MSIILSLKRAAFAIAGWCLPAQIACAQHLPYSFAKVGTSYHLSAGAYEWYYMGFEYTDDLTQPFSTLDMSLGTPAPVFSYTPAPDEPRGFFRIAVIDAAAPRDTDADGIDDFWELKNGLDPLDPADALLPSIFDPSKTNLEWYRGHFGLSKVTAFYSRETTVSNGMYAMSRELSVFNFPIFTGAGVEAVSKELSVFNFRLPGGSGIEAISLEISVSKTNP